MERPRQDSGKMNMIKEYYIHVWKCYYETHNFLQLIMIINKEKKTQCELHIYSDGQG